MAEDKQPELPKVKENPDIPGTSNNRHVIEVDINPDANVPVPGWPGMVLTPAGQIITESTGQELQQKQSQLPPNEPGKK
jgi:hypothetical protein